MFIKQDDYEDHNKYYQIILMGKLICLVLPCSVPAWPVLSCFAEIQLGLGQLSPSLFI